MRPDRSRVLTGLSVPGSRSEWSAAARARAVDDGQGEGLIFQFFDLAEAEKAAAEHSHGTDAATELLYQDALDIYERARR
jgi:hypothetical protein